MGGQAKPVPTKAELAKAAAAASAAVLAKAQAAKSAKIQELENAIGGKPAWVTAYNTANKGSSVISPTIWNDGSLQYVTNNLEYYNPSGEYIHGSDTGFPSLGEMLGNWAKGTGNMLADTATDLSQTVVSGVEAALKNPLGQIALAVALPGIGSAITAQLVEAGVMSAGAAANAVGAGIAKAAINIASGQNPEDAIKNALVSTGLDVANPEITKAINSVVNNPAVTKAIVNAGSSAAKVAASGGNSDAITNALIGSIASSGATTAINTAITDVDPTTAKVLGATISGAINNGAQGAVSGALNTLATQAGKELLNPSPATTVTVGGTTYDINNTPAGFRDTPESSMTTTLNAQLDANKRDEAVAAQSQADREQAAREAVRASEKTIEDTLTDAGLVQNTDATQALNPVTVSEKSIPQDDLSFTGSTGNNRVTDSSLPVNPNVGGNILAPVTVTGKKITEEELQALDPVYINAKRDDLIPLEQMPPLPSNKVTEVVAGKPEDKNGATIPIVIKPTTSAKPTPTTSTTPTTQTTPTTSEQLYQTTTQSQPTTLADIKYFMDISGEDILPPKNPRDPLESLLNQSSQPMSLDDLLRHLRS